MPFLCNFFLGQTAAHECSLFPTWLWGFTHKPHKFKKCFQLLLQDQKPCFCSLLALCNCCLHQKAFNLLTKVDSTCFSCTQQPSDTGTQNPPMALFKGPRLLGGSAYLNENWCESMSHMQAIYILKHLPWILIVHLHTLAWRTGPSPQYPRWPDSNSGIQPLEPTSLDGGELHMPLARRHCGKHVGFGTDIFLLIINYWL